MLLSRLIKVHVWSLAQGRLGGEAVSRVQPDTATLCFQGGSLSFCCSCGSLGDMFLLFSMCLMRNVAASTKWKSALVEK